MKLCTNCGKEIPESSKFCPECGASTGGKAGGDTAPLKEGVMVGGIQVRAGGEELPPETMPGSPVEQDPGASLRAEWYVIWSLAVLLGIVAYNAAWKNAEQYRLWGEPVVKFTEVGLRWLISARLLSSLVGSTLLPILSLAAWRTSRWKCSKVEEQISAKQPAAFSAEELAGSVGGWAAFWGFGVALGALSTVGAIVFLISAPEHPLAIASAPYLLPHAIYTIFFGLVCRHVLQEQVQKCRMLEMSAKEAIPGSDGIDAWRRKQIRSIVNKMVEIPEEERKAREEAGCRGAAEPAHQGAMRPDAEVRNSRREMTAAGVSFALLRIPAKESRPAFWMGETPVTQALWTAVMREQGKPSVFDRLFKETNPSINKDDDRHPVENVSWNDCQTFLKRFNALPEVASSGLTYRLATEEEWERACRAGAKGKFCRMADGTEITAETLGRIAWYEDNSNNETHPVGRKEPNAWGLYDMNGNVWEWTATVDGDVRVLRGGSYRNDSQDCRSTGQRRGSPDGQDGDRGFRLSAFQDEK